jgi:hypothetical protein
MQSLVQIGFNQSFFLLGKILLRDLDSYFNLNFRGKGQVVKNAI